MMTDKATVELSAPVGGKVIEINGKVGETVAIGSVLAVFETDGEAAGTEAEEEANPPQATAPEKAPREEIQAESTAPKGRVLASPARSEEHTSELQSLMRTSYAVFCLKKKNKNNRTTHTTTYNNK